ncbi:MAG: hypothetical protein LBD66_01750 [Holosporales bacterium]|jgi:hypothetical protein|nr:hypothetical protein [Holosporales bacterium]
MPNPSFPPLIRHLSDRIDIQSGAYRVSKEGQEQLAWSLWRSVWAYLQSVENPVPPELSWKPTAYRVVLRGDSGFPRLFRVIWHNTIFVPTTNLKLSPKHPWISFSMLETR